LDWVKEILPIFHFTMFTPEKYLNKDFSDARETFTAREAGEVFIHTAKYWVFEASCDSYYLL